MFVCTGFVTTPATLAAATFPDRLAGFRFEIPEPFDAMSNPWTFKPVRVPTDVIFVCTGLVTTPATLAAATFPIKFEELRFERPEPLPVYRLARTVERFETPKTLRVAEPYTTAELTYKVPEMLAEPRT